MILALLALLIMLAIGLAVIFAVAVLHERYVTPHWAAAPRRVRRIPSTRYRHRRR